MRCSNVTPWLLALFPQDRLSDRYQDIPAEEIQRYVTDEADRLDSQPIQAFLPILVERAARNRLGQDTR